MVAENEKPTAATVGVVEVSGERSTERVYDKLDVTPEAAAASLRRVWDSLADEDRSIVVAILLRMESRS